MLLLETGFNKATKHSFHGSGIRSFPCYFPMRRYSVGLKFRLIHRKTPALELFLRPGTALKKRLQFSWGFYESFKNAYFRTSEKDCFCFVFFSEQLFCWHPQLSLESLLTFLQKPCCIHILSQTAKRLLRKLLEEVYRKISFLIKLQASRAQPPTLR